MSKTLPRNYTLDQLLKAHGSIVITPADDGSGWNVESVVPVQSTIVFQSTGWIGHGLTPQAALNYAVLNPPKDVV
jgi:hypothetical protein